MNLSRTEQIKYYDIGVKTLKHLQNDDSQKTNSKQVIATRSHCQYTR